MRLINVRTGQLEEFFQRLPRYAILSHTWGSDEEEISFRDLQHGAGCSKTGVGRDKFDGCCRQALQDGLEYAWVDTCCIDKANSTELSEAINSMFAWYQQAATCYAFLADVSAADDVSNPGSEFRRSRWFERGWTLQELLAPAIVRFYSCNWSSLGTKRELSMVLAQVTGIPRPFLHGTELGEASVAQRMSWAAKRVTKRKEDIAYCLLGIFGVTMPMIYGEGEQAFRRLQEEIMRRNTDNSILAWNLSSSNDGPGETTTGKIHFGGVLAANPAEFANSGDIVCREQAGTAVEPSYVFGGHLRVHLCLYITATNQTFGLLNCHPKDDAESVVGIPLFGVSSDGSTEEYIRPDGHPGKLLRGVGTKGPSKLVRIYNDRQNQIVTSLNRRYGFYVEDSVHDTGLELVDVEPSDRWERDNATINTTVDFKHDQVQKTWVRFRQKREECRDYVAMLELEVNHSIHPRVHARCHIMTSSRDTDLKIIASKFGSMTKNTFGRQSASNGISNILVTLNEERVGAHQMFVLRLSFLSKPPTDSVDVTLALAQADRKASLRDLLFEDISIGSQRSSIGRQIREKEDGIQSYKEQLAEIQTQLSQLQVQKMMLDEGLTEATREFKHLDEQDGKLKKYQQALSQDVKATQDLLHTETTSQWHESLTRTLLFGLLPRSDAFANISLAEMSRKALVEATVQGCEVVIQFLLDGGFDFESKDDQDNSLLSIAASKGHEEVIQMLADKGANIESVNCQGVTPLLAATLQGNTSAAKLLLDLGSSIEAKIKDVQLSMNLESLVHQEHGGLAVADAQSHCGVGWTPLLVAVAKGNRNLTSLLVTRGADPETITSSGKTPLAIAAMKGDDVLTTYLLDRGADIKTRDANGWTPLFHATSRNNNPLMRLLIDRGANIQAEDTKGQSLLNLAAEKGHNSALALLKDSGSIETLANGDKASSQQDLHVSERPVSQLSSRVEGSSGSLGSGKLKFWRKRP